jgi:hypothetical protein
VARVGAYGELGAFRETSPLATARTGHAVVVVAGDVYAVGGSDGASPLATVERAHILDPAEAPAPPSTTLALGDGVGLPGGAWTYRIAATRAADDPHDPAGETIASAPRTVWTPARDEGVVVTLAWTAVPGAAGYRIYRSATPGAATEALIGTVTGADVVTFVNAGAVASPSIAPREPGDVGAWQLAATLGTARAEPGVVAVPSTSDPAVTFLYAAGGLDADGALATFEWLTITAGDVPTVSGPTAGAATIGTARARPSTWTAVIGSTAYVWIGGGESGGVAVTDTRGFAVDGASGAAGTMTAVEYNGRSGAPTFTANELLFVLGGGVSAETGAAAAQVCTGIGLGGCTPDQPPHLRNWNNLGTAVLHARNRHAVAHARPFVYILGGSSATEPLAEVERAQE